MNGLSAIGSTSETEALGFGDQSTLGSTRETSPTSTIDRSDVDSGMERAVPLALIARRSFTPTAPQVGVGGLRTEDYHKPRGQWWVGPSLSVQWREQNWKGGPNELVHALEGNGKPIAAAGMGIAAGRRWPSGLGLWGGIEFERSQQAFRHTQRYERAQEQVVVNQLVTLNASIVFVDADTIITMTQQERVSEGADHRVHLRLPVEFAWQQRIGRFVLGPRAGAVLEYTQVRATSSLAIDPADGLVRATNLSPEQLNQRYPLNMSALVGVDLGFCLSERLTLSGTPFYCAPLSIFNPSIDAYAAPQRFGLRVQLLHRL